MNRRPTWWLWAAALAAGYAAFGLAKHARYESTGYDLGLFDQAVRSYAGLHAPVVDLDGWGTDMFGDHFQPILVLLVPVYWIWPDAAMLIVAQAVLIAVSVVPLAGLAERRLGRRGGHAVAAAYGLSFGVQGAVAFDFHEVCFAAPLLSFGLTALCDARLRAAFWWTLPLLLVKEELGLTAVMIGFVLARRGAGRAALGMAAAGSVMFAATVGFLIPEANAKGVYPHMAAGGGGLLLHAPEHLILPPEKLGTLALLAAMTGFAALRSDLVLIALPTIVVRFLSDSPAYWGIGLHYSLVLMPVVFAAALDALPRLAASPRRADRFVGRHAATAMVAVAVLVLPSQPLWSLAADPGSLVDRSGHTRAAAALLARIPDGARVEATNYLAPHLTDRTDVILAPNAGQPADWAVIDPVPQWPATPAQLSERINVLLAAGWQVVDRRDGIVLLRRDPVDGP